MQLFRLRLVLSDCCAILPILNKGEPLVLVRKVPSSGLEILFVALRKGVALLTELELDLLNS